MGLGLFDNPLHHKLFTLTLLCLPSTPLFYYVWTKHVDVQELDPRREQLFRSPFYKQYNPNANPSMNDVVIRRWPLWQIRPDLLDDARDGGGKLVEAFAGGCFGTFRELGPFSNSVMDISPGRSRVRFMNID
jgi:hypothetical protein